MHSGSILLLLLLLTPSPFPISFSGFGTHGSISYCICSVQQSILFKISPVFLSSLLILLSQAVLKSAFNTALQRREHERRDG